MRPRFGPRKPHPVPGVRADTSLSDRPFLWLRGSKLVSQAASRPAKVANGVPPIQVFVVGLSFEAALA